MLSPSSLSTSFNRFHSMVFDAWTIPGLYLTRNNLSRIWRDSEKSQGFQGWDGRGLLRRSCWASRSSERSRDDNGEVCKRVRKHFISCLAGAWGIPRAWYSWVGNARRLAQWPSNCRRTSWRPGTLPAVWWHDEHSKCKHNLVHLVQD